MEGSISFSELCKLPVQDIPIDVACNLFRLHYCLNSIRRAYLKPMVITSGFRSIEEHLAIYEKKGKEAPLQSLHLIGAAADISDPHGELKKWIIDQVALYNRLDIYFEDFDATPGWLHTQIYPPTSGKRFFLP